MRTTIKTAACLVLFLAFATAAEAQLGIRAQVITESYSFSGLPGYSDVTETTIPIGLDFDLGQYGSLTLSTGYVMVDLTSATTAFGDQSISSLRDTEFRFSYNIVPGRFVLLLNGALPTGNQTVELSELAILGAIGSDVIGFSANNVGTGGAFGGGFAGAFSLGRFALGIGATARKPLSYQPFNDPANPVPSLEPGVEVRGRVGLQGPLARNTYVRLAGIYASRGRDDFSGPQNGVGNRFITYVSLNQGIGSHSATLYAFGIHRGDPKIQNVALNALPRGRVTSFGARLDLRPSRRFSISPRAELRTSKTGAPLTKDGSSMRIGSDFTWRAGRAASFVIQASYVDGELIGVGSGGGDATFNGYRVGAQLNWTPQ